MHVCRAIQRASCLIFLTMIYITFSLPLDMRKDGSSSDQPSSSLNYTSLAKIRDRRYYQNEYDQRLYKQCDSGNGVYAMRSVHDNHREDRRWNWQCRSLVSRHSLPQCYWTRDVNDYDEQIAFLCRENYYLAGVESYHDNHHEDRRWSFYCCNTPGLSSSNCYTTGYQNSWDGVLDFRAHHQEFITGVLSHHNNHKEQVSFYAFVCTFSAKLLPVCHLYHTYTCI